MGIEVCNGIEIINYDDKALETLKMTCNFDNGALQVLEALSFLIDDLVDRYEYEANIPYRKIFDVLKHVIQGACERENVRNALITGLVVQKKQKKSIEDQEESVKPEAKTTKEPSIKIVYVTPSALNKAEVTEYAKTHTLDEIAVYFKTEKRRITKYIYNNKIEYVKKEVNSIYLEKIKELAKQNLTCAEIARLVGCSKVNVSKLTKKYNITLYKKPKK